MGLGWTFGVGLNNKKQYQVPDEVWGESAKGTSTLKSEEKYKRLGGYFACYHRAHEWV